jgi:hypothetical protein
MTNNKDTKFSTLTLSPLRQQRLSELTNRVMRGDFRHHSLIPMAEINSSALSSSYLRKKFRDYKPILENYFDVVNASYQFGNGTGRTRKYKLKDWAVEEYLSDLKNSESIVLTRFQDKKYIPIRSVPESAVHEVDINGVLRASQIELQPIVKLNINKIDSIIDELENAKSVVPRDHIRIINLIHLYQWKKALNNTLVPNSILQLYQESTNGRLSPLSKVNSPNFISTPNRIRKILFSDMDLYSYDISNCHFSIFNSLAEQYGVECPNLKYYLENKQACRNEWSEKYYVSVKSLKAYIISWLYGGGNNVIKENSFYSSLGDHTLKAIKQDKILSGIFRDIVRGRKVIVENHRANGVVTNILGKERDVDIIKSDLCFILFGYESKIMEIVNQKIGDDMKVLIYDGWIGNKVDVSFLESEVERELELTVSFDEELIESPSIFSLK